ncbi:MAG: murein biosynthesis integral membrane protein MurJ [Trichodesmium sp. St16_bin2-tuft]|nr:murein biosynthesis integral membrane protein MurJ [Trichodesmium sp. St16_bin2-tuft]
MEAVKGNWKNRKNVAESALKRLIAVRSKEPQPSLQVLKRKIDELKKETEKFDSAQGSLMEKGTGELSEEETNRYERDYEEVGDRIHAELDIALEMMHLIENPAGLPSISPLFSSIALIGGIFILVFQLGEQIIQPEYAMMGGLVLAWATLIGATLQWLIQVPPLWRAGLGKLRFRFNFQNPGVQEITKVMIPATLSSGMLHINVYTDLFFASYIPQAAASLGYSGLLVQTPLGIISNVILVPFLPIFSRLAAPENWQDLKYRIRQALVLTAITMLPLSAVMVTLALPIIRVVYERYAFDLSASKFVASVLMAYAVGMFVYLGRDVLVRVFYALGDGETPFKVSVFNIFLNALLDYLLINAFGAPGLVLATVGVNLISMVIFLWLLDRKLGGLPWGEWLIPFASLIAGSLATALVCWTVLSGSQLMLGSEGFFVQLLELALASFSGLGIFGLIVMKMNLPEVDIFVGRIRQKLGI